MSVQLEDGAHETHDLVRELEGRKCFCGARKAPMQTFCSSDYFALPKEMRAALYNRIGEGYEEAYAAARNYFKTKKRR